MTSLGREIRAVAIVSAMIVGVVLSFPVSELNFKARSVPSTHAASAAFIVLTAEEEAMALKAAKSAWQSEATATQRMRARLPLGELPEEEVGTVLEFETRAIDGSCPFKILEYPRPAALPSRAQAPMRRLDPEPEVQPPPAFSRENLLNF